MKRVVVSMLVVAMSLSMFNGCGTDASTDASGAVNENSEEVVELSFLGWGGTEEIALIESIIEKYEEQTENVKVNFEVPADYWPKLQTMVAGNESPDIFYLGYPEFVEYYNQGVLLNMEEYLADYDLSDFYDSSLDAYRGEEGDLYGVAKDWGTYVFYYNVDLFEASGVKSPDEYVAEDNWTMETMRECALEIQAATDAEFGVVVEQSRWKAFVGDDWVTEDGEIDLTSEQFATDLQFMADLWLVDEVAPDVEDLTTLGASDRFSQGNTAMYMSGRWMAISLDAVESLNWNIVPMPVAREDDEYTWVDSVCLSVAVNSEYPEEAMDFIKFYVDEWSQTEIAKSGLGIPVRESIAESESFTDGMEGINNSAHIEYEASTLPVFDNWNDSWTAMNDAFTDVFNGTITADEGAVLAQQDVDDLQN